MQLAVNNALRAGALPQSRGESNHRCLLLLLGPIVLWMLTSCSQVTTQGDDSASGWKFLAKPDSVIKKTDFGVIYLSKDTSSLAYDWLVPSTEDAEQIYAEDYASHIRQTNNVAIKNFPIRSLKKKWTSLFWFDDRYCLYGPSDWMANWGVVLSDSIHYMVKSDGDLSLILEYRETSPAGHFLRVINYHGQISSISIELIDPKQGISIWSYVDSDGGVILRQLMVESDRVKDFPILVFDCGDQKCVFDAELGYFTDPPYDSLRNAK